MSHYEIDARRLLCPMPVIRLQQAIADYQAGDTITMICTDPGVKADIPAWCSVHGHQFIAASEQDGNLTLSIKVT